MSDLTSTPKLFNDESHIVYVNNSIQDDTPLGRLMHDFSCADPDEMFYKIFADRIRPHKEDKEQVIKMAGVMDRIKEQVLLEQAVEFAKKLIVDGELSLKKIAKLCELPLEKVQELAANISAETKGQI